MIAGTASQTSAVRTMAAVAKYRNSPLPSAIPNDYALLVSKQNVDLKPYIGPGLWLNNPWPAWIPGGGGSVTSQIFFQTSGSGTLLTTCIFGSPEGAYSAFTE